MADELFQSIQSGSAPGSQVWGPGSAVGPYRVLRKLGEGGMGAVYHVQHLETGGDYALKTLSGQDPELSLRFQREVEGQARVDQHPHVVRIHAAGSHQGRLYFVMDLAAGGDLAERLRQRPLEPEEAVCLVRDLARGMAHVHAHGILHRDLKPQNVLFDGQGTPKLVDFGLAKVAGTDSLTQTGEILGTPVSMAPEQAKGLRDQIDARCDVYGLGALLHTALTREPLFQGANPMQVLLHVCNTPPTPPSRLAAVPPTLDAIVLRCLEKEPQDRFGSAAELADALDAWLARAPSRSGARLTSALALGSAVAFAAALLAVWWSRERPPSPALTERSPTPSPTADPVPALADGPETPPTAAEELEQRFDAFLANLGEPYPVPPDDIPESLRLYWESALDIHQAAPAAAQLLRAAGFVTYSRQFALLGSAANPEGWIELGRSLLDEKQPDYDVALARRCFEEAAEDGNISSGSLKLGLLSLEDHARTGDLEDLRDAARWFRDGLARLTDDQYSRSGCAGRLGRLALDDPQGGAQLVSPDEAIKALERYGEHAFAFITHANLLRKTARGDRADEVVSLYARARDADASTQGDQACVELAHVLRDGLGALDPDPAAAFAVLRDRLPMIETRTSVSWDWAPPLRVRYELAEDYAGLTGSVVPADPRRAAELWSEVVAQDAERQSWLYWASHWRLRNLAAESDDAELQRLGARAQAELERGALAGAEHAKRFRDLSPD